MSAKRKTRPEPGFLDDAAVAARVSRRSDRLDLVGLQAPLWMMFGLALIAGLVALGIRETAPRVLASAPAAEAG